MKKVITVLLLILLLVTAMPASAKGREMVGERLNIYPPDAQEFPAGTPFHVAHGWLEDPPVPIGGYDFVLELDGVLLDEDFRQVTVGRETGDLLISLLWVYNFPDGMTGEHTFVGHWYAPCSLYGENCTNPNAMVEAHTTTVTVTFTP